MPIRHDRGLGEQRGSVGERIYQRLYDAIVSHDLLPGRKLAEDAIADSFGVSRTVVRPALRRLADDGVVDLFANRGAFVARPDVAEAREIFAARRIIEAGIVAHLSPPGLKSLRALERHVADEDRARAAGNNRELLRLAGEYHLRLAELSGNRVLVETLRALVSRSVLVTGIYQRTGGDGCRTDHHRQLIALLRDGHMRKAGICMCEHLQTIEDNLQFDSPDTELDLATVLKGETGHAA